MYKVSTINGDVHIEFPFNETKSPIVNGAHVPYEITGNVEKGFQIQFKEKTYKADILKADYKEKTFLVKVNGQRVELKVQDRFDELIQNLGLQNLTTKKINALKSPMPGLVLDILVEVGQSVQQGEPLMILEAMKMENILKAPADVVIKNIKVSKGKAVEKNELLFDFE